MNPAILAALLKYGPIVLKWVAAVGLPEVLKWLESQKKASGGISEDSPTPGAFPRSGKSSMHGVMATPSAVAGGPDVVSANHALASASNALTAAVDAAGALLTALAQGQRMVMAALGSINQQ